MLAGPQEDALGALSALAAELHAPDVIGSGVRCAARHANRRPQCSIR